MEAMQITRKQQKSATRKTLKSCALKCFAEEGYSETTIRAITRAAGVAHGTFYVHFPGKEALLEEMLAEFNAGLAKQLVPIWIDAARPLPVGELAQRVQRSAALFLEYLTEQRAFVQAYAEMVARGLSLANLRDGINPPAEQLLRGRLQHALGEQVDAGKLHLATQAVLALWIRVGLQYLFNDQVTHAAAMDVLVEMTIGALGGLFPTLNA
jgi:AcrR family transcriptional regulator